MALDEYKRKRDFAKTPEPSGEGAEPEGAKDQTLFFCVQKHLASHLHYDLRLEWNGVLLSWAVPKGPSLNTKDKRLAMQTEDHPYGYGTFEGVIPEGYGAGIVMLWDRGTWTPEVEDVDAALRKGDLKFTLDGFKLKGSWVLVRTAGRYAAQSGRPDRTWLLIKHRDDWAGPIDITTFAPLSVKTPGADLADILASDNPDIWRSHAPAKGGDSGAMYQRIIARALEIREEDGGRGGELKEKNERLRTKRGTAEGRTERRTKNGTKNGLEKGTKNGAENGTENEEENGTENGEEKGTGNGEEKGTKNKRHPTKRQSEEATESGRRQARRGPPQRARPRS